MSRPTSQSLQKSRLRPIFRIFFVALNLALGAIPSLGFFTWIERNCTLPWVAVNLEWPWFSLPAAFPGSGIASWAGFDFLLILSFGAIHSAAAQKPFYRALEKLLPPQAGRTIYLAVTGLAATCVMAFWQNTGRMLWVLPFSSLTLNALSIGVYVFFMGMAARLMNAYDAFEFIGLKQIYLSRHELTLEAGATRRLNRGGWYARVRHPIYFFTLLAVLITPWMSLDRAVLAVALLTYLSFGIPIEERKLRSIFGAAYSDYQKQVPALWPSVASKIKID